MATRLPRGMACAIGVLLVLGLTSAGVPAEGLEGLLDRQWYHHGELTGTPGLRAEPHHTVILHLESTGARGKAIRNSIPYRFREAATLDFCVPKDDPHIRSLTLAREGSAAVVVHVPRGAPCKTRTIAAGHYMLHIEHDGTRVPADGRKAFIHMPRPGLRDASLATTSDGLLQATASFTATLPACGALTDAAFWTSIDHPLHTLVVDGAYIGSASYPSSGTVTALKTHAAAEDPLHGWSFCMTGSFIVPFNGVNPSRIRQWKVGGSPDTVRQDAGPCSTTDHTCAFLPQNIGPDQFDLWSWVNGMPVVHTSDQLAVASSCAGACWAVIKSLYRVYREGASVPPAQAGEVQLLNAICGQAPTATYVRAGSLPDLGEAGIKQFTSVVVRPGPGTAVVAYPQVNYTGTPHYITEETCLTSLPASIAVTSTTREFVASSNTCTHCDLSGVNLSGLDLTGGDFTGTAFNNANLTNTNFQSAILDFAHFRSWQGPAVNLTGTNFLGAHLNCADFQATNLRPALFWSAAAPIQPVIRRDFSCRLDLAYAGLNWDTFPLTDWRYLHLLGAGITGASGRTLSPLPGGQALDLSNAHLNGTNGLTHVGLTGANLSSANLSGTDLTGSTLTGATLSGANLTGANLTGADLGSVVASAATPATFNHATLTHAFMKNAHLSGSFFRGAALSPVNLGGADLSGAFMEDDGTGQYGPVILVGSYMLNTKLNGAHMTNAVLDQVSWYNASPSSPVATGAGALLTGASFNLADLPGLDLTGAQLQGANLTNAQLIGANLTNARLEPDGTRATNLSTANLRGADLTGANFTGANLFDAGVATTSETTIYIEVLSDPDHYQHAAVYQYLSLNRPATKLSVDTVTSNAVCPNGERSPAGCGPITDPKWVAPVGPQEPDCNPTHDADGNVTNPNCSSGRHPAGG